MPFSKKSLDFLFENRLNDSKEWYNEHKDVYKECITKPFTELLSELAPVFEKIDDKLIYTPSRISRVYRDTRFSKDKSLFRDNIWFTVSRRKERYEQLPGFYFDINQSGFEYGCGYYQASTETMQEIRSMVLDGSKSWKDAEKAIKSQSVFTLAGDCFKRSRFPDESEEKRRWLDRKNIFVCAGSHDFNMLFSDKLADKLKEEFPLIAPVYKLFIKAEENITEKRFHTSGE